MADGTIDPRITDRYRDLLAQYKGSWTADKRRMSLRDHSRVQDVVHNETGTWCAVRDWPQLGSPDGDPTLYLDAAKAQDFCDWQAAP